MFLVPRGGLSSQVSQALSFVVASSTKTFGASGAETHLPPYHSKDCVCGSHASECKREFPSKVRSVMREYVSGTLSTAALTDLALDAHYSWQVS
jgi:hypothetical protein